MDIMNNLEKTVQIHPATAERWVDMEQLFGSRGGYAGCWCMYWRVRHAEFGRINGEQAKAAMQELSDGNLVDAPPAASAPVEVTPSPAPVTAQETPPASPADEKPVRRPFWARLLRRSVPEEPAAESESAPEPVTVQESAPEPVVDEAPVVIPETESAPTLIRKVDASSPKKKSASAAKASKPRTTKPKAAAKSAAKSEDKKKVSPKARQSKRRR